MLARTCLALVCSVAAVARADLVLESVRRNLLADAFLIGSGGGSDMQEDMSNDPGPFDSMVSALVDRGSEGRAYGFASQVSDFAPSFITAHAVTQSEVMLGGQLESGSAGGISAASASFHVDDRQVFTLSATITYSGDPGLCVVVLRRVGGGGDLFRLEASGSDGSEALVADVVLLPGTRYELLGFAGAVDEVNSPFGSEVSRSEYELTFTPVPAPASCIPGLALLGFLRRRRWRSEVSPRHGHLAKASPA